MLYYRAIYTQLIFSVLLIFFILLRLWFEIRGFHLKITKLSYAIITALGVSSVAIAQETTEATKTRKIETIEVTATKRAESIQDVPVTVSALSGDALENLGVDNFQDYVEFLPNVVFQGTGPGQN